MVTAVVAQHRFRPRGAALALFESRAAEVLLSGPAGTGKSRACLEKLHAVALKYPGMRGLIVRKTASSLPNSALDTFQKHVIKESVELGHVKFYGGGPKEAQSFRYSNGSTVTTGGMDKSTRVMSSEYDVIYVQEATELSEENWEALTTRLRNGKMPYQQLIADCNPDRPTHWLKLRADGGKTLLLPSKHEDNPTLFNDDGTLTDDGLSYIQKLDNLTGVRHARLRQGLWAAAEGLVYEEFSESVHLVDQLPAGSEAWPRYWAIDFGFTNPFVCQMWAEDHDGRLWLYREFYQTQRLVEDHAKDILATVKDAKDPDIWLEPKPRAIICDHDAEDRATLERHLGLSTSKAHKGVSDGIQAVSTRLRVAGDALPRLFFVRDALVKRDSSLLEVGRPTCTIDEITGYVWDKTETRAKEQPVKNNDHGMDAMRYVVAEQDLGNRFKLRFL